MLNYENYKKIMLALLNNSKTSIIALNKIMGFFNLISNPNTQFIEEFNIQQPEKVDVLEAFNILTNHNALSEEAKLYLLGGFFSGFNIQVDDFTTDYPIIYSKLKKFLPNTYNLFTISQNDDK